MDVQGDYDPVDAAGFIKVNALRSVSFGDRSHSPDSLFAKQRRRDTCAVFRLRENRRLMDMRDAQNGPSA